MDLNLIAQLPALLKQLLPLGQRSPRLLRFLALPRPQREESPWIFITPNGGLPFPSRHRRKSGGWCAQYTVYTANGRKRKTLYGKARQEVAAKLAKVLSASEGSLAFDARNLMLGEYLDLWLRDSVKDTVRLTTYQGYERIVRLHIKPTLGRVKLENLTPTHLRSLYRERLESGMAPRMVQLIHTTLHKALKQAAADGLLPRNVAGIVRAPRSPGKEIKTLAPQQARALLQSAHTDRLERFANRMVLCKDLGHGHLLEGPKDQGLGRGGPGHAEERGGRDILHLAYHP